MAEELSEEGKLDQWRTHQVVHLLLGSGRVSVVCLCGGFTQIAERDESPEPIGHAHLDEESTRLWGKPGGPLVDDT